MDTPIRSRLDHTIRIKCLDLPLHHHHYLVLHHLFRWMRDVALPEAHGTLLDYGCGGRPYEELFTPKVDRYVGADVATAADTQVDVLLEPDRPVPLADASIDTVLANQTLEHVPDPSFYIGECARLLKPGGVLILTAPMQWRHHEEPYDYHRFTRFGIERLLRIHGLELKDLRPCGGAYALIGQIWLGFLFRHHPKPRWLVKTVNRLFLWLDTRYPDSGETINWMCIARKPSAP
jgi:SAM-dependent methyltransferase